MRRRRTVLAALAGLAGCGSRSESTQTATDRSPPPSQSATENESPTETESAAAAGVDAARAAVNAAADGAFERAHDQFAPAAGVSLDRLRRLWAGMTAQHGTFDRITATTVENQSAAVLNVACAMADTRWAFPFDENGTLTGVRLPTGYSPPAYADRAALTERSATVAGELPATLTLPAGDDSVPGVVLVHGSGPLDRDETVGPNRTFRDLAWGLASRGIAVLRYDKRTHAMDVPTSEQTLDSVTIADAVAAVERLGATDRIGRRIVVGHSLGAVATPRILARSGADAGALLAANARNILAVATEQVRHQLSVVGGLSESDERQLARVESAFDNVRAGEYPAGRLVVGRPAGWWRSLLAYDQVAAALDADQPLRLVQGDRDYQIPHETEFTRWQDALADRPRTSFRLFERLSHHFHPGTPPSLGAEYVFHDNVARVVVEDLAGWIRSV